MGKLGRFFSASITLLACGATWAQDAQSATFSAPYSFAGGSKSDLGLNLGRVGVFDKAGTTLARSDTSVLGNAPAASPDQGFGLSWAGGLSYDFTPHLTAIVEYANYDLHLPSKPVRTTSLGLQYRY